MYTIVAGTVVQAKLTLAMKVAPKFVVANQVGFQQPFKFVAPKTLGILIKSIISKMKH